MGGEGVRGLARLDTAMTLVLSAIDEDDESASLSEQDDISWEGQGSRLNVVVSSVSRG